MVGFDKCVMVCVVNYFVLSDMVGYKVGCVGGYFYFFKNMVDMDIFVKMKIFVYYDVVNFVKQIIVFVYMIWGFNDNICFFIISYIVYNVLNCLKEVLIILVNEYWIFEDIEYGYLFWIKKYLK